MGSHMSGGGGSGLCSHFRGICTDGSGSPEDRGRLSDAVDIAISQAGALSARVIQAFEGVEAVSRHGFGGELPR